MKLSMSLKELLSALRTKKSLIFVFALVLLEYFSNNQAYALVVVYNNKIKGHTFEETHLDEEADTRIPQVLASTSEEAGQEICVLSPDTDVLTICIEDSITFLLKFLIGNLQGLCTKILMCLK